MAEDRRDRYTNTAKNSAQKVYKVKVNQDKHLHLTNR